MLSSSPWEGADEASCSSHDLHVHEMFHHSQIHCSASSTMTSIGLGSVLRASRVPLSSSMIKIPEDGGRQFCAIKAASGPAISCQNLAQVTPSHTRLGELWPSSPPENTLAGPRCRSRPSDPSSYFAACVHCSRRPSRSPEERPLPAKLLTRRRIRFGSNSRIQDETQ